jgi:hypothetical protein
VDFNDSDQRWRCPAEDVRPASSWDRKAHQNRIFNGICIIAAPKTGLNESERTVKGQRRLVRRSGFEKKLIRACGPEFGRQGQKKLSAETLPLVFRGDGDGFKLGLRGQETGDGKTQ